VLKGFGVEAGGKEGEEGEASSIRSGAMNQTDEVKTRRKRRKNQRRGGEKEEDQLKAGYTTLVDSQ